MTTSCVNERKVFGKDRGDTLEHYREKFISHNWRQKKKWKKGKDIRASRCRHSQGAVDRCWNSRTWLSKRKERKKHETKVKQSISVGISLKPNLTTR